MCSIPENIFQDLRIPFPSTGPPHASFFLLLIFSYCFNVPFAPVSACVVVCAKQETESDCKTRKSALCFPLVIPFFPMGAQFGPGRIKYQHR